MLRFSRILSTQRTPLHFKQNQNLLLQRKKWSLNNITSVIPQIYITPLFQYGGIIRTMKYVSALRRRCPNCRFVTKKRGRQYVVCSVHPRHKQAQKMKHKVRPW